MKVFEYDENQIKDLQKKSKIGTAICAVAGFLVCLILFLVHSRSNTIIILPIVCIIAAATVCVTLGIVLGRLGYLKQYGFIVKKAATASLTTKLTYIGSETSIVTRDHLRFTKSNFTDDGNNVVTFCVLVPHNLDLKEGQRVSVVHVDDILLSVEAIDE